MSKASTVVEEKSGAHVVRWEPPDLFVVRFIGPLSADELVGVGDIFRKQTGRFYVIIHTAELGSFTSAAKKAIKAVPLAAGLAIVGASRQMQLMLSLLNKVYMMVNFGKNSPITFVATEDEALRWVADLRKGPPPSR